MLQQQASSSQVPQLPALGYDSGQGGWITSPRVDSIYAAETKRPAFRSTRLKETDTLLSETLWTKSRFGKKASRRNYIFFLGGIAAGLLAAAAIVVEGYLSAKNHKYCLVLEDHFDGPLDTSVWKHEIQAGGFANHEFQWTTDSTNNSFGQIEDGHLYIVPTLTSDQLGTSAITNGYQLNLTSTCTASNPNEENCVAISDSASGTVLPPIQNARLTTKGTRSIKYGRVEVRAKMSKDDWTWPSIWMLPRDNVYGDWPVSGEIDIAESKGNVVKSRRGQFGNTVRSSLHFGPNTEQDHWFSATGVSQLFRNYFNNDFYTFGLEWDDKSIWTWRGTRSRKSFEKKFDRNLWDSSHFEPATRNGSVVTNPWKTSTRADIAPFDQDFYLILDVAVGGTNGYFADSDPSTPNKPWSNSGINPRADFWKARDSWLPTWPKDPKKRGMAVDYVKKWQQC